MAATHLESRQLLRKSREATFFKVESDGLAMLLLLTTSAFGLKIKQRTIRYNVFWFRKVKKDFKLLTGYD